MPKRSTRTAISHAVPLVTALLIVGFHFFGDTVRRAASSSEPGKDEMTAASPKASMGDAMVTIQLADISGDPEKPRRHFRVRNAASLTPHEAGEIYTQIVDQMYRNYGAGEREATPLFRDWPVYNTAPYRSATHGQRYVNNYANDIAKAYGQYEQSGLLPVGSLLAKDSFTVTRDGVVEAGPLFLMEKMPAGFNRVSGDWRYSMIMADGEVFGVTKGRGAQKVEYCIGCHLAREETDHLYYVPEELRVQ